MVVPAVVVLSFLVFVQCQETSPGQYSSVETYTEKTHNWRVSLEISYTLPLKSDTEIQFVAVMGDDALEKRHFVGNKSINDILANNTQPELEIFKTVPDLFLQSMKTECVVKWDMGSGFSSLHFLIPIMIGPKKCQASFKLPEKVKNIKETVSLLLEKVTQMNTQVIFFSFLYLFFDTLLIRSTKLKILFRSPISRGS